MRTRFRHSMAILGVTLCLAGPKSLHSQIRLPKLPGQAQKPAATGPAVQFDDVTLELTVDRIDKLLAAKQASKRIADGPTGPAALRAKADQLDERQAAIYNKSGKEIEKWDEKKRAVQNCRDSSLLAIKESKKPTMADVGKLQELSMAMLTAQQKGDTAGMRRVMEQMRAREEPTAADSAAVNRRCGSSEPIGVVKEWVDLKDQIDQLRNQANQAEVQIDKTETSISGMNARQRAVSCERIKKLIEQLRKKQEWKKDLSWSDTEKKAFDAREQAIRDLEALCP